MKQSVILVTLAVWATLALTPATAGAETVDLGTTTDVDLVDIENGLDIEIEQDWTISDLRPSADVIPFPLAGSLWEATGTVFLADGGVPVIPGFFAGSGDAVYPVLWDAATPLGINPGALGAGGSATGKLYFDVTGPAPTSVAFRDADDLVVWQTPRS